MNKKVLLEKNQKLDKIYKKFTGELREAFSNGSKVSINGNELIRIYADLVKAKKTIIQLMLAKL